MRVMLLTGRAPYPVERTLLTSGMVIGGVVVAPIASELILPVTLAGRSRLVIPEGFREFLGVDAGSEVLLIGAAVCVEIWQPTAWVRYLEQQMPEFHRLSQELSA